MSHSTRFSTRSNTRSSMMSMAAAMATTGTSKKGRAADLGAGAVPCVLRDDGQSAQTAALNSQIEASNLWNFFQAKNIRRTSTIIASEQTKFSRGRPTQKAAIDASQTINNSGAAIARAGSSRRQGRRHRRTIAPCHRRAASSRRISRRRPPLRIASAAFQIECWRQHPSSPAWSR